MSIQTARASAAKRYCEKTRRQRPRLVWPAALVCGLALASGATAQTPSPAPCAGKFLISDPAGDHGYQQQGQMVVETPPSTDLRGVFFRVDADTVTANLAVSEVPTVPPAGFYGIRYRAYFSPDGVVRYVQALVTHLGVTYSHGREFQAATFEELGPTTGAIGQGVVQIVIPADVGGRPGTTLQNTGATVAVTTAPAPAQAEAPPLYLRSDSAPDGDADSGPTTVLDPCAAEVPAADDGRAPEGAPRLAPDGEPRLALARTKLSARKVNRKRSATLTLNATQPLTAVTATLNRGSKLLARGALSELSGTRTLRLKLKGKLRKGQHTLIVAGTRADGSLFSAPLEVVITQ
jgi:hypothetical protein